MTSKIYQSGTNPPGKSSSACAPGDRAVPTRAERTHTSQEAIAALSKQLKLAGSPSRSTATLVGRLRSMRPMGKITFAHIEDGDGRIQLFLRANDLGEETLDLFNREFDLGDFIQASGEMFRTRTGEVTLRVKAFRMLAKAITPLPAAKDEVVDGRGGAACHPVRAETRYRQRYADLAVNPEVRQIFRTRAAVVRALREFLDEHGFLEVETPILQPHLRRRGGAALHHPSQPAQAGPVPAHLLRAVSQTPAGGRAGARLRDRARFPQRRRRPHAQPRVHPARVLLAYADYLQVMELTEQMVAFAAEKVLGSRELTYQGHEIDLHPPWRRLELRQGMLEHDRDRHRRAPHRRKPGGGHAQQGHCSPNPNCHARQADRCAAGRLPGAQPDPADLPVRLPARYLAAGEKQAGRPAARWSASRASSAGWSCATPSPS